MAATVTAYLIVRDEERVLGRCLESLRPHVDEIVVVDTGSTDATKEIAARWADRVVEFAWIDDFAAARNVALDHASGDWAIWFDADDVLVEGGERLRALAAEASPGEGAFHFRYVLGRDRHGAPTYAYWRERMVRNDGTFRWVGRVHEVLVAQRPSRTVRSEDVVIDHRSDPGKAASKQGRNLRILEQEVAQAGTAAEPRKLFYLAREYADHGQVDRALEVFADYLAVSTWDDERYQANIQVANLLRRQQRYEEAIEADLAAARIAPRWPMAYFGLAKSHYFLQDWTRVIHWTDVARALPPPDTILFVNAYSLSFEWIVYYTNALYHVGDRAGMLAWTLRALELSPEDTWHRNNLASIGNQEPPPADDPYAVLDVPTFAVIPARDRHQMTLALLAELELPPERMVVVDRGSAIPARGAIAGLAHVIERPASGLGEAWNAGLDAVAATCPGPHNVALLSQDFQAPAKLMVRLAQALRANPGRVVAHPDHERLLPPGSVDAGGAMGDVGFMLRGEEGLRADPQFLGAHAARDLERRARLHGAVARVGGAYLRPVAPSPTPDADREAAALAAADEARFTAKWGVSKI